MGNSAVELFQIALDSGQGRLEHNDSHRPLREYEIRKLKNKNNINEYLGTH